LPGHQRVAAEPRICNPYAAVKGVVSVTDFDGVGQLQVGAICDMDIEGSDFGEFAIHFEGNCPHQAHPITHRDIAHQMAAKLICEIEKPAGAASRGRVVRNR
jgi:hypothetical protein